LPGGKGVQGLPRCQGGRDEGRSGRGGGGSDSGRPIGIASSQIRQVDETHSQIAVMDTERRFVAAHRCLDDLAEHAQGSLLRGREDLFTLGGLEDDRII